MEFERESTIGSVDQTLAAMTGGQEGAAPPGAASSDPGGGRTPVQVMQEA